MTSSPQLLNSIDSWLTSKQYSNQTKTTYKIHVQLFIEAFPRPAKVKAIELLEWLDRPEWGNSHRRIKLNAIQQYLKWKYGSTHPALSAKIPAKRNRTPRCLTAEQALKLLAYFSPSTIKGVRDLAIASLALDTGLRVSELCRLKTEDVDLHARSLQVVVKGGTLERARFSYETTFNIERWLNLKKGNAKSLFTSTQTWKPLTREGLQTIIKKWGKDIGIKLSPHDLRRTFATLSSLNGAPTRIVQVAGRWKTMDMVELYTQSIEQDAIDKYLPVSNL
jgi:integrase/recombinase XerD